MTPHAHILVVDDDVTTRILIRTALSSAGFGVTLAAGGREGLEAYRSGTFDLVMLDVDMPDMNGYEVCTALRAEAGALLPIVMVTGMDDVQSVGRAYDSGATDFIAKPVNPALIPHRVRYLLRGYQSLRDLRAADARNAAVLNAIPDMLLEVGLDGDLFSCHVPAFHRLAGSAAPCDGRHLSDLLTPAAATACREAMEVALRQGSSSGIQYVVQQGSESAWFELSVAGKAVDAGDRPRFIVLSRDITDRKASEARIAKLAYVDSLTGLPNRHAFLERVDREIGRAGRTNRQMAVLFMDLDGFKTVNDTLGHGAGDLILQWAAERLRAGLRPADVLSRPLAAAGGEVELARLGGDEFTALILDIVHVEDALAVARRIGHMMRRPFTLDDRTVTLTTSIGVALYPDDGRDAATLLKHADTAMYHAKNSGRDNAQMYSVSLTEQAVQRLELDASLRVALEREEFFLVYQPQYDVASHTIRSVEALVRWNHPRRGAVPPLDFVPLAEENGVIEHLGAWVLHQACADAARWNRAGHRVGVAVNLSPVQFNNPGLLQQVESALTQARLDPALLELEITESALMEHSANTIHMLQSLRAMGVCLALDDFGTGYSSLGYLTRMPITNLKVDRCFVTGLLDAPENLAIVKAVLAMAGSLDVRVTAEGVETAEQALALRALDCHTLQGFYFSRPVPADQVPALLTHRWPVVAGPASVNAGAAQSLAR